ncbi:MAG TPA: response regulator [Cryptosporangiaceae bacterium]|nr:response regulator [Cryptosporangiaceae bacterium]
MTAQRRRAKILLVDDRPENLLVLEAILQGLDQDLVTATSGEDALKCLLTDDFAVILLDVQMPGMDGFETAEHIKRRERTRHVPIVFLTALDREPNHAFRGYATGAVDYLAKPFDPWVLRAKVAVFVDLWEKNRLLQEQTELLHQRVHSTEAATSERGTALGRARVRVAEALARLEASDPETAELLRAAVHDLDTAAGPTLPPPAGTPDPELDPNA